MVKHHTLKVSKTGHYYTSGTLGLNTRYVWMVCHGYGQAADRFIMKFDQLDPEEHFIIAPEGFSRFYWNGLNGEIVSSWMTSKDRLDEIEDYLQFLHRIIGDTTPSCNDAPMIFMGFSQGCATILRYIERYKPAFSHIILWAGTFPKEINFRALKEYLTQGKVHLIYGHKDEYLTSEMRIQEEAFIEEQELRIIQHFFEGRHRIDKDVLNKLIELLL